MSHLKCQKNCFPGITNVFLEANELFSFLRTNLNKFEKLHQTIYASIYNYANTYGTSTPLTTLYQWHMKMLAKQGRTWALTHSFLARPGEAKQLLVPFRILMLICWSRFCMILTNASRKLSRTSTANLNDCFTITKLHSLIHEESRDGHVGI